LGVNKVPGTLLTLSLAAYGTIFLSLKRFTAMYALETENLIIQNDSGLLYQSVSTMAERLQLMDEVATQHSLASHDRRHFNSMILGLLEQGEVGEAVTYLRKQNEIKTSNTRFYCDNKAINAATSYYVDMAEQKGIQTKINLTIPVDINVDSMELALVVSNLIENAIHGVDRLPEGQEKYIHFTCLQVGRLLIEISNPCIETVTLDKDGLPFTTHSGHEIGTGLENTNRIVSAHGASASSYAAGVARAYTGGGYTDWFLPSWDELQKLRDNNILIGNFVTAVDSVYWTSSESTQGGGYTPDWCAHSVLFDGSISWWVNRKTDSMPVRAIRYF
jgi:hypothetical protein